MSREMNGYQCEILFEQVQSKNFLNVINFLKLATKDYEKFIHDLEYFFNSQLEEGDLENFSGEVFELSDVSGELNFPFCIKDEKLTFVETDYIRSTILSALAMNRMNMIVNSIKTEIKDFEETHEQYSSSQLQFNGL